MGMVDRVKAQTVPEAKQASCGAGFGGFLCCRSVA